MALLASKQHTAGDKRRWVVNYSRWLDNTATIDQADIESASETCAITDSQILGKDIVFFLDGGELGETFIVTIVITDSFQNKKTDTISFHVVAP